MDFNWTWSGACDALGVEPGASTEEIRNAYRREASISHPDRGGAPERFIEIRSAYEFLRGRAHVEPPPAPDGENGERDSWEKFFAKWRARGWGMPSCKVFFDDLFFFIGQCLSAKDRQSGFRQPLTSGILSFIRSAQSNSDSDMQLVQLEFLKALWAKMRWDFFEIFDLVCRDLDGMVAEEFNVFSPWIAYKVFPGEATAFFAPYSFSFRAAELKAFPSDEKEREVNVFAKKFALVFASAFNAVERPERSIREFFPSINGCFLTMICKTHPECFEFFADSGWFDLSDSFYEELRVDPVKEIMRSGVPVSSCAKLLDVQKGIFVIALALKSLDMDRGRSFSLFFEDAIERENLAKKIPETMWSKFILASQKARDLRSDLESTLRIRGFSWRLLSGWRAISDEKQKIKKCFVSVMTSDIDELSDALREIKASGLSLDSVRMRGVPLLTYLVWLGIFETQKYDHFVPVAFDLIKKTFSDSDFDYEDVTGNSLSDWLEHLAIDDLKGKYKL